MPEQAHLARILVAALAGITAYIGYCLLNIPAWRRLPGLPKLDAAAFLVTALSILFVNAAAAVALGCFLYAVRWFVRHRPAVNLRFAQNKMEPGSRIELETS